MKNSLKKRTSDFFSWPSPWSNSVSNCHVFFSTLVGFWRQTFHLGSILRPLLVVSISLLSLVACEQQSEKHSSKQKNSPETPVAQASLSTAPKKIGVKRTSQEPDSVIKIGVLNFNKVWQDAKASTQIREAIQEKRRHYQKEIIELEEKLRYQETALQEEHEKLSASEYQEKRKQFEEEVLSVQKQAQIHKKHLEQTYTSAMAQVSQELDQIVKKMAQEKNLSLILSQNQVAFTKDELDITKQVLEDLDSVLPFVELSN